MRKWFPLLLALALCLMCTAAVAECEHYYLVPVDNGDGTHDLVCETCGYVSYSGAACYEFPCTELDGICDGCGSSNPVEVYHSTQVVDNGDGTHDIACKDCGYVTYDDEVCYECSCENYDGICDVCGGSNPSDKYHPDSEVVYNGDGTHSILCTVCGTDLNGRPIQCFEWCDCIDGVCDQCGGAGTGFQIKHDYSGTDTCQICGQKACQHESYYCVDKGDYHQAFCADCETFIADYPVGTVPSGWLQHGTGCGICSLNGALVIEACSPVYKSTADVCSYVCSVCEHEWSTWNGGEHSFEEYTTTNDEHSLTCITCGYTVSEAHVYTDEDDNDCDVCGKTKQCQHTYWFKVPKQATCTETGTRVNYCNLCGKEHGTETIPAKGHDLSTEDKGDYILESCSRCDYENKIEKQVEAAAEEAPVEETSAEEAPVTDGLQIAEAAEVVTLPETVTAAKAFTVAMMKDGQSVQPEEATTVTLTLTEEELTAINGLKLMLVLADGTLVEVPYEVIDGQVVFTAETLGAFAFIAE